MHGSSVLVAAATGNYAGLLVLANTGKRLFHIFLVLRMNDLAYAGTGEFLGRITEMFGIGRAGVAAVGVNITHGDQIVHVVHDGAKEGFTPVQRILRGFALRDVIELHKKTGWLLI